MPKNNDRDSDPVLIELHRVSAQLIQLQSIVQGHPAPRARYLTESRDRTLGERCVEAVERLGDLTVAELARETGSALSAVGRAVKAEAAKGQLTMVSEPADATGNSWRWRVYVPDAVSTRRRARASTDIRALAGHVDDDDERETGTWSKD